MKMIDNMMTNKLTIEVEGREEKGYFYGMIYNRENEIEFQFSYPEIEGKKVFNRENGTIDVTGASINVSKKEQQRILQFEAEIKADINELYKNIVIGEEKLICIPLTETMSSPMYVVTTKTILDKRHLSPKYTDALLYAFSKRCLDGFNVRKSFDFKDQSDMQMHLSSIILKEGHSEMVELTLKEVLFFEESVAC